MKKRLLSLLLVMIMCITMVPAMAFATDGEAITDDEIITEEEVITEEDFILEVAGIKVTEENAADILGDGSAKFDPETCTLTLTDAGIANDAGYGIYAENMDLIIHGIDTAAPGNNEISGKDIIEVMTEEETAVQPTAAIYSENGTVTITGVLGDIKAQSTGIYGAGGVTIKGTIGNVIIAARNPEFPSGDGIVSIAGPIDISGTVGDIVAIANAIDGSDGDITISGTVGTIEGFNAISVAGGDVYITGTVAGIDRGAVTDMGGCAISAYGSPYYDFELGEFNGTYGGDVHISGKIGVINGCACGIWADGDIIITGTDVKIIAHDESDVHAVLAAGEILAREVMISEPADYTIAYYDYDEDVKYKTIADKEGNIATTVMFSDGDDACDGTGPCPSVLFSDIDAEQWYHKATDYVLENGLMNGVGDDLFDINGTTTRAMVVTMLWRMEGCPKPVSASADPAFTDVEFGLWYSDAIEWAATNLIVEGIGEGLFGPMQPVTREQLATILYRYADMRAQDMSAGESTNILSYVDAESISEWAMTAMQWACGEGIISGKGNNDLVPGGYASRVETAQMFMNFLER